MKWNQKYIAATVFALSSLLAFSQPQLVSARDGSSGGSGDSGGAGGEQFQQQFGAPQPSSVPIIQNPFRSSGENAEDQLPPRPSFQTQTQPGTEGEQGNEAPNSAMNWSDFAKQKAEEIAKKKTEFATTKKQFGQKISALMKERTQERRQLLSSCVKQEAQQRAETKNASTQNQGSSFLFNQSNQASPSGRRRTINPNRGRKAPLPILPCRQELSQFEKETQQQIKSIRTEQSQTERFVLGLATEVPFRN